MSDITNPRHKYWDKKGSAESALSSYKYRFSIYGKGVKCKHKADALKVVTIKCIVEEWTNPTLKGGIFLSINN